MLASFRMHNDGDQEGPIPALDECRWSWVLTSWPAPGGAGLTRSQDGVVAVRGGRPSAFEQKLLW